MCGNRPGAHGVGGNTADPANYIYPAVPYGPEHFHSPCGINNYNDAANVSTEEQHFTLLTKKWLSRREWGDTYLTHVWR